MSILNKSVSTAILVTTLSLGLSASTTSRAAGCTRVYADCMNEAAEGATWIDRSIDGMDCTLDYVQCARIKVLGF